MWINIFGQDAYHAIAEIAILWTIFYIVFKAVRGTRAMQVLIFLGILFVVSYLCQIFNLSTIQWLISASQLPIIVALVILYTPEMRRTVSELTSLRFFHSSGDLEDPVIAEVSKAAQILSRRHIGALVTFERRDSLQNFVDTGIRMDSLVSSELLVSIFSPLTPLHDGAVIIQNKRLAAAACLYRLSEQDEIDSAYGTRHRAALGIAEETDAVTVVVSEETGAISLALNGRITRGIDAERFPSILLNVLKKGSGS